MVLDPSVLCDPLSQAPPLLRSLWNGLLIILGGIQFSSATGWGRRGRRVRSESCISQDALGGRNKTLTQAGLNNREFIISHVRDSRRRADPKPVESPIQQWHLGVLPRHLCSATTSVLFLMLVATWWHQF